jgi:hypothetical protein
MPTTVPNAARRLDNEPARADWPEFTLLRYRSILGSIFWRVDPGRSHPQEAKRWSTPALAFLSQRFSSLMR